MSYINNAGHLYPFSHFSSCFHDQLFYNLHMHYSDKMTRLLLLASLPSGMGSFLRPAFLGFYYLQSRGRPPTFKLDEISESIKYWESQPDSIIRSGGRYGAVAYRN